MRDVWPEGDDGTVIVHEQYRQPARWWNPATRLTGMLMILLATGWPVILLSSVWIRTGVAFTIADFALLATGLEVFRFGGSKWMN